MRYLISAGLASLLTTTGPAQAWAQQPNPFKLAQDLSVDGEGRLDYVAPLRGLAANKALFDADAYRQALETYNSFVGKLTPTFPLQLATPYGLAEVEPLLAAGARATSVVIINEAHNQPAHRAYCRELLQQLAPLGYTYFAVEALSSNEAAINERKFPLSTSGFYVREPNFGKLLRAACASGFHVFGHEITPAQEKDVSNWRRQSNYRDSMQAVSILAVLRKHPQAKIVAYVGYDHVLEMARNGTKRLATYLRELGHLDPFTIDQTETYQPAQGPLATKPMALVARNGTLATIGDRRGYVDMQIMHPAVTQVQGRPSWLASTGRTKAYTAQIPAKFRGTVCLAQLYDREEYQQYGGQAIPLDQYFTDSQQQQVVLFGVVAGRAVVVRYQPAVFK